MGLRNVLLLTFCAFVLSRCVPDSICSDGDACTGTLKQPDLCGQDICNPGAPVCPVFVKSTPSISGEEKGSLEVTNNEKWVYLIWNSESEFRVKNAYLYVSRDPLQTDDPSKFPFHITMNTEENVMQARVSLEMLKYPTELDPIYIALRLENAAGAGIWMEGLFTPTHHSHGGSFSFTSVCHCDGYSHTQELINYNVEIYSFSEYPFEDMRDNTNNMVNSASCFVLPFILLIVMLVL